MVESVSYTTLNVELTVFLSFGILSYWRTHFRVRLHDDGSRVDDEENKQQEHDIDQRRDVDTFRCIGIGAVAETTH